MLRAHRCLGATVGGVDKRFGCCAGDTGCSTCDDQIGHTAEELPQTLADEPADYVAELRRAVIASVRCMLGDMPERYREPVRLAEIEGLPLAKIALRMDLSLMALKSRVRRGRAMLKKRLRRCRRFEFDRMGRVIGWESRKPCSCS